MPEERATSSLAEERPEQGVDTTAGEPPTIEDLAADQRSREQQQVRDRFGLSADGRNAADVAKSLDRSARSGVGTAEQSQTAMSATAETRSAIDRVGQTRESMDQARARDQVEQADGAAAPVERADTSDKETGSEQQTSTEHSRESEQTTAPETSANNREHEKSVEGRGEGPGSKQKSNKQQDDDNPSGLPAALQDDVFLKQFLAKEPTQQMKDLVVIAMKDGIRRAVDVAKMSKDPYLLDMLHDRLVDELHDHLVDTKRLPKE